MIVLRSSTENSYWRQISHPGFDEVKQLYCFERETYCRHIMPVLCNLYLTVELDSASKTNALMTSFDRDACHSYFV